MSKGANQITANLQRAWLRRLAGEWRQANEDRLEGVLRAPAFRIEAVDGRLGSWNAATRTLAIAAEHVWQHRWTDVVETLLHEVAHQYVDEVLGGDERPHGERFAYACRLLGIDAGASGRPIEADDTTSRMLAKIRKLLALAESDNRHEAEAAMAAANTLLLRYNLELPAKGGVASYRHQVVGQSAAALPLAWKLVAGILSEFFFVESIWVQTYNARRDRSERQLELLGSPTNLDLAVYVHDFLHGEVERLWRVARSRVRGGRGRKREYIAGVLMGFSERLREERRVNSSKGLVWVGDADLDGFVRKRFPRLRSLAGAGVRRTDAHEAGRAAGKRLTIRQPVSEKANRGRLLRG